MKMEGHSPKRRVFSFYEKRVKRLLPALSLFVFTGLLSICLFSREPTVYLKTGLLSLAGLSNLYLFFKSTDYWGVDAELNPFTHTWSLGVEEQFYFIYPILLIAFTRGSSSVKNFRILSTVMAVMALLSLLGFVVMRERNFSASYFLMPFRFWEMALGCLVYFGLRTFSATRLPSVWATGGLVTLVVLCALFSFPSSAGLFPPLVAPVLTAVLIIILVARNGEKEGESDDSVLARILLFTPLQYLGKISYSLYLWHWLVLALARWTIGITWQTAPFLVALMFAAASLSYHFWEQPLRHKVWFPTKKSFLSFALVASFLLGGFGLVAIQPTLQKALYAGQDAIEGEQQLVAAFEPGEETVRCEKIRLLGNSHARHWLPMIEQIGRAFEIEVLSYRGKDSVSIPSGTKKQLALIDGILAELEVGDWLILSNRNHVLYQIPYVIKNGQGVKQPRGGLEISLANWFEELEVVLEKSQMKGIEVCLFLPTPEFKLAVARPELYQKEWFRPYPSVLGAVDQTVSEEELRKRFPHEYYSRLTSYAQQYEHFHLFDPNPYLEGESGDYHVVLTECAAYSDSDHLSRFGALRLLEPFHKFFIARSL